MKANYTMDALGLRTREDLGNSSYITYTYHATTRWLTGVYNQTSTPTLISSFAYTHDKVGNRTTMTELNGGTSGAFTYTYNANYRLITETLVSGGTTLRTDYYYDEPGNRIQKNSTVNGITNYAYNNANQCISWTDASGICYLDKYNGAGNLITETNTATGVMQEWGYDYENHQTVYSTTGTSATYKIDAMGRRISKTVNGTTEYYFYDGANVFYDIFGPNSYRVYITAGLDQPVWMMTSQMAMYYYLQDGLGSVVNLLDSSQSVVNTYIYTAFGETIINSEMVPQRYKFTGREWDSESSTQHSRERQYRPQWGRFLRRDPIGYGAGINLYSYCDNNPVNYTDPLGLWKIIRNSKMRRGIAIAELGDTIDKLARIVKLDPTEISRWAHKKSPLSLLLTMAVNPAISYSPKPDHSLMTSEIYDFPNTVHVAIGNVKPGPVEGFLFGNPHRMLAEQVSNDMITSAKNDGYFVEHDFDCETNDVTDMLNDSNIWGFVFWGHGGGNMADACLGFRTGTLYPGHIKLKYHLGKVILNSCYSNGNQGDGSQDFKSSFIGSNPYGVFKGCDSLWYIGLGIFITNAQLYWNEPLSDKQPLLPLGGGPRNPSNKVK